MEGCDKLGNVSKVVKKETLYIAATVFLLSVLMQSVFLIIQKWDYTVLLGNLIGGGAAVLNFFLMGLTVQKAVEKEAKEAKNQMKLSQKLRLLMLLGVAIIGVVVPWFNMWATIIPMLFPRIAVSFRPLLDKKRAESSKKEAEE